MATVRRRRRQLPLTALLGLAAAAVVGCGDDSKPDAGAGGGSGAGGEASALDPTAYLPTSAYDCTATGPFEPPERPYPAGCFADVACSARLITAHRIATPFAPENSLSALRAAILLGVDIVETDVQLTADGEVVFIHDGDVDRTFDGTGAVSSLTLAEFRAMPMHVPPGLPAADFSCERAPTLDEMFGLAAGRVVIDLDVKDAQAGVQTAEYMRDHGLYGDAYLLCSPDECAAIRAAVPDAPIMSRPQQASQVAEEILYDPPPVMVHVDVSDPFLASAIVDSIHGVGAKVFANGMATADIEARLGGRLEAYGELFDRGLDVQQVENPHLALVGLGRLDPPGQ
ncbi:MAG: glycerophosphodiester phosphodiesterase family protein [Deltaproteobacteria bacterium]|jgi:glycerophosphoryl diester phosphodiesterase|nr:glycerophosphodiester phosphodiesterase family protein [Deltaproteobacteria bacterium]MBW2530523.1 glycerophosphodiester phosphodiesterase family protein [Deltaproteobacteria bacterium]